MTKKIKELNFGFLLEQESEIITLTEKTFRRPLNVLDETTKFLMNSLDYALSVHQTSNESKLTDYCKFYLTQGNAILHMIRLSRLALVNGYYGGIAVLTRTFVNYLNVAIYIHHHPEDANLLLKESREDFKNKPEYKKKFHEFNLRKELESLGYKDYANIPDDFAKVTHGSLWGAQVFGYKDLKMKEGEYELSYSPKFSNLQASKYLSLMLAWPIDFAMYFVLHLKPLKLRSYDKLEQAYHDTDFKVNFAIRAIEKAYQIIKYMPPEVQKAILRRLPKYQ